LFAALEVKTSRVITQFHRLHRAVEFREFLDTIDAQVPGGAQAVRLDEDRRSDPGQHRSLRATHDQRPGCRSYFANHGNRTPV
jgi:hypothetical protein